MAILASGKFPHTQAQICVCILSKISYRKNICTHVCMQVVKQQKENW